jgi:MFS family permease
LIVTRIFGGASRALATPLFRRYWIGHSTATVGRWMYRTAVGWLAWDLTHSTGWLGALAFADLLPTVVLSLVSGAVADRIGFMRIINLSQILATLLAALLAALILSNMIDIYSLMAITFALGAAEAFGQPARMSAVNAMVTKRDLSSAIALGSASFNGARIIGPAIAGALILWIGAGYVISLCALTFALFYLQTRSMSLGESGRPHRDASASLLADARSGIAYMFSHHAIRFVMILLAATSFFIRPVIELLPAVSGQTFQAGPTGLALLLASIGVGALSASLLLARRGELRGLTFMLVLSTLVTGVALALSMQAGDIWLASLALAVMGAFMLAGNVSAQTLVQNSMDPAFRARVMSLYIIFAYGLPAIGAALMGWIATAAGLQATIAAGALCMLAFFVWSWPRRKAMAAQLESERSAS